MGKRPKCGGKIIMFNAMIETLKANPRKIVFTEEFSNCLTKPFVLGWVAYICCNSVMSISVAKIQKDGQLHKIYEFNCTFVQLFCL